MCPPQPGQQHLQDPRWPCPAPCWWPCWCSAATPSALWDVTCLRTTACCTGGPWCSCNKWGDCLLAPVTNTQMTLASPRRCLMASSCRRLKPSLSSMWRTRRPSTFSAQRPHLLPGTRPSWSNYARDFLSSWATWQPVPCRRQGWESCPWWMGTPSWGTTSRESPSICKRSNTALVPGRWSEQRSWNPCMHRQSCIRDCGAGSDTPFKMEMVLSEEYYHTPMCPVVSKTLISAVIMTWTESICHMYSGVLNNLKSTLQTPVAFRWPCWSAYLAIYLFHYL